MISVEPIGARQIGEYARLLEERGFGSDIFQKHFIEDIKGGMEYLLQKLAVRNGSVIEFPIVTDLLKLTRFVEKGYDYISEYVSLEGLAVRTFDNPMALLLSIAGFNLGIAKKRIEAMGLRFGDIYELVAFNASYPDIFPASKPHTIFSPGSIYEIKLGLGVESTAGEGVAASMRDVDGRLKLFDSIPRATYTPPYPHFILVFRK